MFGAKDGEIDPRAGRLEVKHYSKEDKDSKQDVRILELEDCKSDIYDDLNMAFERYKGDILWKCIKDLEKINLQGGPVDFPKQYLMLNVLKCKTKDL